MNEPGKDFLASSAFPRDHDGGIAAGHFGRQLEHPLADRVFCHRFITGFLTPAANNLADGIHQETRFEWLHQIIDSTGLHGGYRIADLAIGRDQHHWQARVQPLHLCQKLVP